MNVLSGYTKDEYINLILGDEVISFNVGVLNTCLLIGNVFDCTYCKVEYYGNNKPILIDEKIVIAPIRMCDSDFPEINVQY